MHTLHLKQKYPKVAFGINRFQMHADNTYVSSFSHKSQCTNTKITYKIIWNTKIVFFNNSDFLCMIVSDMTFHNFYRIWLVSAYFAFETIVQIHVGSKCDSLFFCHIRKYKYKMYKQNPVINWKRTIRNWMIWFIW